jgi:hypothetical protein
MENSNGSLAPAGVELSPTNNPGFRLTASPWAIIRRRSAAAVKTRCGLSACAAVAQRV